MKVQERNIQHRVIKFFLLVLLCTTTTVFASERTAAYKNSQQLNVASNVFANERTAAYENSQQLNLASNTASSAPANTDDYYMQVVYIVPSDAPEKDRAGVLWEAAHTIQKQWSTWGWSFRLTPNVLRHDSSEPCTYFQSSSADEDKHTKYITKTYLENTLNLTFDSADSKIKYIVFIECSLNTGVAGAAADMPGHLQNINGNITLLKGNISTYYNGILDGIALNDRSRLNLGDVGSIGHELGHNFGLVHENCDDTAGPMCNGKYWPEVIPHNGPPQIQPMVVMNKGCDWLQECSGGETVELNGGSLVNVATGKCVREINDLELEDCSGALNQSYITVPRETGFALKNQATGNCITLFYSGSPRVYEFDCNTFGDGIDLQGSQTLQWIGNRLNQVGTNRCLTVDNGEVTYSHCTPTADNTQFFRFSATSPQFAKLNTNTSIQLKNAENGKCIAVSSYLLIDDAEIIFEDCGAINANFELIEQANNAEFWIRSMVNGKCLNVPGAAATNGIALVQYSCDNVDHATFSWDGASLKRRNSTKCLEASQADNDLEQNQCASTLEQQFSIVKLDNVAPQSGIVQIKNRDSGDCIAIEDNSTENDKRIETATCDSDYAAKFELVPSPNRGFWLKAIHSDKCLNVPGAVQGTFTTLVQYSCANVDHATFYWSGNQLKVKHSDLCLEEASYIFKSYNEIEQRTCDSAEIAQRFDLIGASLPTAQLINLGSEKCISITDSSVSNNATVEQQTCSDARNQQFTLVEGATAGQFSLKAAHSGRCLNAPGATLRDYVGIVQYDCDTAVTHDNLSWVGETLLFAHSNKCLTVQNGSDATGVYLEQKACDGSDSQRFRMLETTILSEVKFSSAAYTKAENGGSVDIEIKLNRPAVGNERVSYATTNGTATSGSDYTSESGSMSFPMGETTRIINLTIKEDSTVEGSETFSVTLSSPTNAVLGSPKVAVVTITDNDLPSATVASATYTKAENGGNVAIQIKLNTPALGGEKVSYTTSNGTAMAGSDFTTKSGTVTFTANQTTKTINVPIINDSLVEGNETFNFEISLPANPTVSLGAQKAAVVTITDDDTAGQPTVTFDSGSATINEGAGTVTIGVSLSKVAAGDITLTYSTQNGSATAGSDFTGTGAGTKSVTFAAGTTKQSIVIPIADDTVVESAETFTVLLQEAPGADPGAIGETTVTITDNDNNPPSNGNTVFLPILTRQLSLRLPTQMAY